MSTQPPEGLRLLGLGSALIGCLMLYVTSAVDSSAMGGAAALMGLLALLAAEALWYARPWAFRTSVTLALGCFIGITAVLMKIITPHNLPVAGSVLGLSVGGMLVALLYIRRQVASLPTSSSQTPAAVPGRMP